jgi:hypothetical protein
MLSSGKAQDWKILQQPPLGLEYELPQNWYVSSFMTERQCQCTGGTINSSPTSSLNMVIFYSNRDSIGLDSLLRQGVWGYTYQADSPATQQLRYTHFVFQRNEGSWKEDKNLRVLRYTTEIDNNKYVLYFWGTAENLQVHQSQLQRILHSLKKLVP